VTGVTPVQPPVVSDEEAGRERWIVWIVTATVFVSVLNTTMVNVALPTIGDVFDAGPARVAWLATLYSLVFGISTPFYGRLGDRYGLRLMFIVGMSIFVISSLVAGVVPEFWMLIVCRVGQALGSAAIPSLGIAMITRTIPGNRRGAAMGLIGASVGAGQALGPTLGGSLTEFASWRWLFLISACLVFLIPPALRRLPVDTDRNRLPVDWIGGLMLATAIAGTLLGIGSLEEQGIVSLPVLGSFSVAALAVAGTVARQRTVEYPFIERILLGNLRYVLLCAIGFLSMGAGVGAIILAPFLLERVNGLSTAVVGLVLLPQAVALTLFSRPMGRYADRYDSLMLMSIGLVINVCVVGVMATIAVGWSTLALVGLFVFLGVGQAMVNSPLSVSVTRAIPARSAGSGLGIYNMLFFVGGGFGAASATALLAARESAPEALLPVYAGAREFTEFGDAYLYSFFAFAVALLITRVASRTTSEPVQETPGA
jgi:MFS transporter, DHA2 family, metal-tetracycline-proton antiporter